MLRRLTAWASHAVLALAFVLMGPAHAAGLSVETGFLDRVVTIDGAQFRYQVYVPRNFQRTQTWPVILSLHGGGEYGDDGLRQTAGGLANAIRSNPDRFPAIAVFPQSHADGTPGWQGIGGQTAMAALDKTMAEFNGDKSRVYLTGYSTGGNGGWYLASRYPDRFAALVVMSGFIQEFRGKTSGVLYPPLVPASVQDPFAVIAQRVSSLPIWIFHGAADPTVPVEQSRRMAAALKEIGADVQYVEVADAGHNVWDSAYSRPDLIAWMLKQRRH